MKKLNNNQKKYLVYVITAFILVCFICGVIASLGVVRASAAGSYTAYEPSPSSFLNNSIISYPVSVSGSFSSANYYIYLIHKVNRAGEIDLFKNNSSLALDHPVLFNGQYSYGRVYSGSLGTVTSLTVQYTSPGNTITQSDYELVEVVIGIDEADIIQYCMDYVNGLNISTDYASYLGSYTSNGITEPYGVFASNAGIQFTPDVYLDSNSYLTFNGGAAMHGGVSTYELYVDGSQVQPSSLQMSNDASLFSEYLSSHPDLSIGNWSSNSSFSLTMDLSSYAYEDILVEIRAYSIYEQRALILYAANIHAYPDPDPEESSFPIVPDPEESDSGSDVETEAPFEEPGYSQGYADGFQAATFASANGVMKDSKVRVKYSYNGMNLDQSWSVQQMEVDLQIPSTFITNSTLNYNFVWDYWYNYSNRNSSIVGDLLSVSIQTYFGTVFRYQPNLMYFSGDPSADQDSYSIQGVNIFNTNGTAFAATLNRDTSLLYNRIYLTVDRAISDPVYMLQLDLALPRVIEFWLNQYELTLNVPKDLVMFDTSSYNLGLAAGEKIGFDKGEISGAKVATDKAYSVGKSEGYDIGYDAGVLAEQSNELRQTFKFYDLFFSIFDALSNTFQSIASFEVFGVNVAAFTLGLVTIGIIAFVIRKVW